MKIVLNQLKHHIRYAWKKILLLYALEIIFLCSSKNVHCIYVGNDVNEKQTDMSYLVLLFIVIPILIFGFQQLYTWYRQGGVRWQLLISRHFPQVCADVITIAGILLIGYLLFFSLYYRNSIQYLGVYASAGKQDAIFWQCVEQQSIMSALLPHTPGDVLSLLLLDFQLSSMLVAGVMALWKNVHKFLPLAYLCISLCICFLPITYTTTIFQNMIYTIFIMGNIYFAVSCWQQKKEVIAC